MFYTRKWEDNLLPILKLNNSHNRLSFNYNIKFEYVNYIASPMIVAIALISYSIIISL